MARKILLADDSVTAQNMGRKILADAGYEVIAVNNGSAALKKIAELKPDLVILDVYMPGYSGLEVCQRLKDSPETSRIPVLLSVGKLEPFKPEEAQRVRAEGYIVKPFEASELLSALSKLEDKVVPRSEPSKPGRFARAIAAAEEAGRGSESSNSDNGWKSRINFPHKKTEAEEKFADESSSYNPMNRDLRTVVETPQEKAESKNRQPAEPEGESRVDVEALAPAGVPRDVTPEEIAAMTAAAAQMQMASAAVNQGEQQDEQRAPETASQSDPEPARVALNAEVNTAAPEESKAGNVSDFAAAAMDYRQSGGEKPEESEQTQDVPITMAAAAESSPAESATGSRWTAVSVALEGEEESLSLDQEMQKAAEAAPDANLAPPEITTASAESAIEASVAAISNSESESAAQPEPVTSVAETQAETSPVAQSEQAADASSFATAATTSLDNSANASSPQIETANVAPVTSDAPPFEKPSETSAPAAFAEPNPSPVNESENPVFTSPAAQTEGSSAYPGAPQESHPAPITEPAEVMASNVAPDFPAQPSDQNAEQTAEPKVDNEGVKSTAAAWASWRQIRDTSKSEAPQSQPGAYEIPEPPAETNARAVAAGAEQILQAAAAAEPGNNPSDVASIVDSVLAGLRPRLMEEITRKMAEKK